MEKSELLPPENGLPARLVIELAKSTHKAFMRAKQRAAASACGKTGAVPRKRDAGRQEAAHRHRSRPRRDRCRRARARHRDARKGCHARLLQNAQGKARGNWQIPRDRDENATTCSCRWTTGRAMASESTADLLISIHADALDAKRLGVKSVQEVRGGTIYTLSETASDEQARILAHEREQGGFEGRRWKRAGARPRHHRGNKQHFKRSRKPGQKE